MSGLPAHVELGTISSDFSGGLLQALIEALRRAKPGELIGLSSLVPNVGEDLDRWARVTGNAVVEVSHEGATVRYVIRKGPVEPAEVPRRLEERLWLYTNFDCNLACDYCCVRSMPRAARNALGLERVQRIATEAVDIGVREIFLTGGEPFLLPDLDRIALACAAAAPTTIFPLFAAFQAVERAVREERRLGDRIATIFHCA
jgi:TusA-related sulfurtransferase